MTTPTWVTPADVEAALGPPGPSAPADVAWLEQATAAANQRAWDLREAAGYTDDPATVPNPSVAMGVVLLALDGYRRRGAQSDLATTFTVEGFPIVPGFTTIQAYLGVPRPAVA